VIDADLDIRLVLAEAACREVEEREVVLAREVLHLVRDRLEPAVPRMLRLRVVVEEAREPREEAVGIQARGDS
jgi:hypothetical protein